jgi:hypothetical protein
MRCSWLSTDRVPIDVVGGELTLQASTQDSAGDITGARHKNETEGERKVGVSISFVGKKLRMRGYKRGTGST